MEEVNEKLPKEPELETTKSDTQQDDPQASDEPWGLETPASEDSLEEATPPPPEKNKNDEKDKPLRGCVEKILFRSEDSGFTVMLFQADSSSPYSGMQTLVGVIAEEPVIGTNFVAKGLWKKHPKFGQQYRAFSFVEEEPSSTEAIIRYLGSGQTKGLGPVLAARVVEHFGEDTLDILDADIMRLSEVPGIGKKKLEEISDSWGQRRNIRHIMLFFEEHRIPSGLAQRIYKTYGDQAIEVVKQNPYILSRDVWRVGFRTADKIALKLGMERDAPERLIAGLAHTLRVATEEGHCFLPKEQLIERASKLLELDTDELLEGSLNESTLRGDVIREEDSCYLPLICREETELARSLSYMLNNAGEPEPRINSEIIEQASNQTYTAYSNDGSTRVIRLSEQQKEAIKLAATSPLVVITGGPGCGKTTVLKTITSLFQRAGLTIKLAAPTGRAAQRMAEVCGIEASTIHRLLKFDPSVRDFSHNAENPLELDALIVDESSMIDLSLAHSLIRAVPAGARIVIVGDADQLPSVGPGRVLADLLAIPQIPRVVLTSLFRRSEESHITEIAFEINSGRVPTIPVPDGVTKSDAYFLEAKEVEDAAALVERLVVEQIPKKFDISPENISVLTPMNQGALGVIELNRRLQDRLVPIHPGLPHVVIGNTQLRLGDRICQRVNNYNIHPSGVFNGDQGEIVGIDASSKNVFVKLWDGREIQYASDELYQLDLAYSLSIHRSQGSEIPAVVVVLHHTHTIMLERQLVYTGVTRAKQLLIVVGTKKALKRSAERNRSNQRFTALVERFQQLS